MPLVQWWNYGDNRRSAFSARHGGGIIKLKINRWALLATIIILLLIVFSIYYKSHSNFQIDDWSSVVSEEQVKNITNSFLRDNSLTKYHINNVTDKYRGKIVDSQINIFDHENNSIGWIIISGGTGKISNININEIEINGSDYVKISPSLWKMLSISNKFSYCKCVLFLITPFSETEVESLAHNQNFEIYNINNSSIIGNFPLIELNNVIRIDKIKSIDKIN